MADPAFTLDSDVSALGVKSLCCCFHSLDNTRALSNFDSIKEVVFEELRQRWNVDNFKEDPVLDGFRDLHTKVGRSNRDYVASPEALRSVFFKKGRFPQINPIVDCYNLISLKYSLALGAHDLHGINGNVSLRLTDGSEHFLPLGAVEPQPVFPGEYAYVDDANNIICRMEVLQVESTKVTASTSDIFLIIQGNAKTPESLLVEARNELAELFAGLKG